MSARGFPTPIKSRSHPLFVGVPTCRDPRLAFAALLTLFAVLGTAWLGFNRTPAQIAFTVFAGCALDMALHFVLRERRLLVPLSAYISSLSIALLLNYAHDWLLVLLPIFATIGSKYLFTFGGRHSFNPSLFGVVTTLLFAGDLISSSPAYQWDSWRMIGVFMAAAALAFFVFRVQRFWLVGTFLFTYALQTSVRAWFTRHHIPPDVLFVGSMTNPSFFLFAFFMMPDPKTSPATKRGQIVVAVLVALLDLFYHTRQSLFTFFYAGATVSAGRFLLLHSRAMRTTGVLAYLRTKLMAPSQWRTFGVLASLLAVGGVGYAVLRPHIEIAEAGFRFEQLTPVQSGIDLKMDGEIFTLVDDRVKHVAKWLVSVGAAVAVGDADGDGREDLLFVSPAAAARDRIALFLNCGSSMGQPRFQRAPLPAVDALSGDPRAHGYASGALFFDADGDGDQDILLLVSFGETQLLLNRRIEAGTLSYEVAPREAGVSRYTVCVAAAILDYDNDGRPDIVLKNVASTTLPGYPGRPGEGPQPLNIFRLPAPAYEGDRRMFFFMHNSWHRADNGGKAVVLKNAGGGRFVEVDAAALGLAETHWTLAMSAADVDGDGDIDLYFANDFGPDDFYVNVNDGGGPRFRRLEGRFFGEIGKDTYKGMNSTIADLSGDGRQDMYVSNAHVAMLAEGSLFWVQQPTSAADAPVFDDEATSRGVLNEKRFGWGAVAVDLNLDGLLDLVQGNGYLDDRFDTGFKRRVGVAGECPGYWYANHKLMQAGPDTHTYADKWADLRGYCVFPAERRRVYLNRGVRKQPQFVDVADATGLTDTEISRGVAAIDMDDDGRMDIVIANQLGAPTVLRNVASPEPPHAVTVPPAGFVGITLVGDGKTCAVDAYGSMVIVRVPGLPPQMRERQPTSGLSAQSDPRMHFGLGKDPPTEVDVEVRWRGGPTRTYRVRTGAYTTARP